MRLFHVSEEPEIELFIPRAPPSVEVAPEPIVWAVAESHLVNYLLPRDCPRVTFFAGRATTAADRHHFLGTGSVVHVVAIEAAWLERTLSTELWLYEMPSQTFNSVDLNAGYYTSLVAAIPLKCTSVRRPLLELVGRGAELRVLPSLHSLAQAVARSSMAFSCIRMRNALPASENVL